MGPEGETGTITKHLPSKIYVKAKKMLGSEKNYE